MLGMSVKTAWRSARARPLAAAAVVVILALGIGAATAIYSVVDAVVLRPLPVREPERLVWMWNARVERDRAPFSFLDLRDYRDENAVLEGLAVFTNWTANLTGIGGPERLEGVRVEATLFSVLGVNAAVGRAFRQDDGRAQVVMLPTIGVGLLVGGVIASMPSRDIPIAVAVGLTLGAVALLACYVPARRAAAADPGSALHDA